MDGLVAPRQETCELVNILQPSRVYRFRYVHSVIQASGRLDSTSIYLVAKPCPPGPASQHLSTAAGQLEIPVVLFRYP